MHSTPLAGDLLRDHLASTGGGPMPLPLPLTWRLVREAVGGPRVTVRGGLPRSAGRSSAWYPDARCRLPLSEELISLIGVAQVHRATRRGSCRRSARPTS